MMITNADERAQARAEWDELLDEIFDLDAAHPWAGQYVEPEDGITENYSPDQPRDAHGKFATEGGESRDLSKAVGKQGGFTWKPVGAKAAKTGYVVSLPRGEGWEQPMTVAEFKANGKARIKEYLHAVRAAIRDGKLDAAHAHVGAWHDKATGRVVLDVNEVYPSQKEAIRVGRQRKQDAIFDLSSFSEIDLRPRGKRTFSTNREGGPALDRGRTGRGVGRDGPGTHGQHPEPAWLTNAFNPDQPRDERGRWAGDGTSSGTFQDRQQTSPEFQRWFKGSKVVDAAGKPLVVYHGAKDKADFNEFDTDRGEVGAHFGTSEIASGFAEGSRKGGVFPVYLNIKNPLTMEDPGQWDQNHIADTLLSRGEMSLEEYNEWYHGFQQRWKDHDWSSGPFPRNAESRALLEKAGYDGIKYINRREGVKLPPDLEHNTSKLKALSDAEFLKRVPDATTSWIAIRPNQIKSAIGNRGTFSSRSKDTRNEFNEEDHPRDEKGQFTSGGTDAGTQEEQKPPGEEAKVLKEKQNGIVRAILAGAKDVPFTEEEVNPRGITRRPEDDEIEEAMQPHERREMEDRLAEIEIEARDRAFEDYDPQVSERDVAKEIGYARDDVLNDIQDLINEYPEDVATRLRDSLDVPRGSHEVEAIEDALGNLDHPPPELVEKIEAYRDKARNEIEEKYIEARDNELDSVMQDWVYDDYASDRSDYLHDFWNNHSDEPRFGGGEPVMDTWGQDANNAKDMMYKFQTQSGNEYEISAMPETKSFPAPDQNGNLLYETQVKSLDFMFSDSEGNVNRTGAGSATEVFRRVTTAIAAMVQRENPDVITFSAADPSRQKLYDRLTKTVATVFPEYAAFAVKPEGSNYKQYAAVKRPLVEAAKAKARESHPNLDFQVLVNQMWVRGQL